MDHKLLEILVSWALALSPYTLESLNLEEMPLPTVEERPHTFFVENVCGGIEKKCRGVVGWYNSDGIIYIDENLSDNFKDEVVVHESAHYIQDLSGMYDDDSCEDSIYRELEATKIMGEYSWRMKGRIYYNDIHVNCKK